MKLGLIIVAIATAAWAITAKVEPIVQGVMVSNWCVLCYPKQEYAVYIYKGNSLCFDHFKKKVD